MGCGWTDGKVRTTQNPEGTYKENIRSSIQEGENKAEFVRAKWCLASQSVDEGSVLSPGTHPKRGGVSTREMTVLMPPRLSKDIR